MKYRKEKTGMHRCLQRVIAIVPRFCDPMNGRLLSRTAREAREKVGWLLDEERQWREAALEYEGRRRNSRG